MGNIVKNDFIINSLAPGYVIASQSRIETTSAVELRDGEIMIYYTAFDTRYYTANSFLYIRDVFSVKLNRNYEKVGTVNRINMNLFDIGLVYI